MSLIEDLVGGCFVSFGYAIVMPWSTSKDQVYITYGKWSMPASKRGRKFLFRRKSGMLFVEVQEAI